MSTKFVTADFPVDDLAGIANLAPGVPMRRLLRAALALALTRPGDLERMLRLASTATPTATSTPTPVLTPKPRLGRTVRPIRL